MNTILVIDDEAAMRQVIEKMLVSGGYTVLSAQDGAEGIDILNKEGANAVILDLQMPGTDGIGILKELRKMRPELPVIILSGFNDPDIQNEVINLGASGFVSKPFRMNELLDTVKKTLLRPE